MCPLVKICLFFLFIHCLLQKFYTAVQKRKLFKLNEVAINQMHIESVLYHMTASHVTRQSVYWWFLHTPKWKHNNITSIVQNKSFISKWDGNACSNKKGWTSKLCIILTTIISSNISYVKDLQTLRNIMK